MQSLQSLHRPSIEGGGARRGLDVDEECRGARRRPGAVAEGIACGLRRETLGVAEGMSDATGVGLLGVAVAAVRP